MMCYDVDVACSQGASKVSIITIGQQAIIDAYLCLIHLTAGILVGKIRGQSFFWFHRSVVDLCFKCRVSFGSLWVKTLWACFSLYS